LLRDLLPRIGLEPTHLTAPDPKSGVSANFTTWAKMFNQYITKQQFMKEAALTIIFYDEKILLVKRRDVPVWVLPGGGIDAGETPEIAAIREAKEETGLDVTITRKVGVWLPINRLGSCAHVFECKVITHDFTLVPQAESQEVAFFSLDALPSTFFFLHRSWLEVALLNIPSRAYFMNNLTYYRAIKTILSHPILSFRYLLSRMGLPLNN
jgi:8-oxo-dGTP diphosphatase